MFIRNPDALWTELGAQIAIMNLVTGRYFEIQGAGCALWGWLSQSCDLESLIEKLTVNFKVEADQARIDVSNFLNQLRDAGLLSEVSEPLA